jgi:hypothetical protein
MRLVKRGASWYPRPMLGRGSAETAPSERKADRGAPLGVRWNAAVVTGESGPGVTAGRDRH